jgi:hypothetical protein
MVRYLCTGPFVFKPLFLPHSITKKPPQQNDNQAGRKTYVFRVTLITFSHIHPHSAYPVNDVPGKLFLQIVLGIAKKRAILMYRSLWGWVSYLNRAATTNYLCCGQALEDSLGAGRIGLTHNFCKVRLFF